MPRTKYVCVGCADKFKPLKHWQVYCSTVCRKRLWNNTKGQQDEQLCWYCGAISDTEDHVVPRSNAGVRHTDTVPCCRECNCIAGAKVFQSAEGKRGYVKNRLIQKYIKVLSMPHWTPEGIAELGPGIRRAVLETRDAKAFLIDRLFWPEIPPEEACCHVCLDLKYDDLPTVCYPDRPCGLHGGLNRLEPLQTPYPGGPETHSATSRGVS